MKIVLRISYDGSFVISNFFAIIPPINNVFLLSIPTSRTTPFIIWKPFLLRLFCNFRTLTSKSNFPKRDFEPIAEKSRVVCCC